VRTGLGEVVGALLSRCLHAAGPRTYDHVVETLWERQDRAIWHDALSTLALDCPPPAEPDPAESERIERLFRAFRLAKRDQARAGALFEPTSLWSRLLRQGFAPLGAALERDDVQVFHRFLANYAGSEQETAIEESSRLRRIAHDPHKKRHFEQTVMAPMLAWWLANEAGARDLSALALPATGNPCGVRVGRHLISRLSIVSDVYAGLLARAVGREGAVIGELACGAGRMAHALVRQARPACYVGLDLPEPLCCASYLLMRAFPTARFLLYGEEPFPADSLQRYDFVLLPAYEIARLPSETFDLFLNENSLGEIAPEGARHFVAEMCRCARIFWHRNHERERRVFDDGTQSLLAHEYPVPADRFACLARHPDFAQTLGRPWPRRDRDLYWYLHVRRGSP
jgi:putative sugar O-methyltransferase